MSHMTKHEIFYLSVDSLQNLLNKNDSIDYSNLGIILKGNKFALCQVMFRKYKLTTKPYNLYVDKASLDKNREKVLDFIIQDIVITKKQLGLSDSTLYQDIKAVINFTVWANNHEFSFYNIDDARQAYVLYTQWLKVKIRNGDLSSKTSRFRQHGALRLLQKINNDIKNEISAGINIIYSQSFTNPREKSSLTSQQKHFSFHYNLFQELTNFLLNNKTFPHQISLSNKKLWLLPMGKKIISEKNKNKCIAFNFDSGEIRTIEEIKSIRSDKYEYHALCTSRDFNNSISRNNSDFNSGARLQLGSKAIYAFFMVFLSITGMNDSTASTLLWDDEYLIKKNLQKFKNIKKRAKNKTVEYQIQKQFINDFRKFLRLREFVLNGNELEYLFFMDYSDKAHLSNKQKNGDFSSYINRYMRTTIDDELPTITSRQMRVNKTSQVLKKNDLISASELAQSSISVILKSYTGASQNSTDEQLTDFFTKFNDSIIFSDENTTSISVGQCKDYHNPQAISEIKGIKTDCVQNEGCLFCKHYGCHADEIDIRKLLSLLFIIDECGYIAVNQSHHEKVYGTVITRINDILESIKKKEPNMSDVIKIIKHDVYENENLHDYWEHKLSLLIELGMIA